MMIPPVIPGARVGDNGKQPTAEEILDYFTKNPLLAMARNLGCIVQRLDMLMMNQRQVRVDPNKLKI